MTASAPGRPGHPVALVARAGYAARGFVYVIVAIFAFLAAAGTAEPQGTSGALESLLGQPFGAVLVWLMVAGLAGHALWRLVQCLLDADGHGHDAKGIFVRTGLLGSALVHFGLAAFAASLVLGIGGGGQGGGGSSAGGLVERLLGQGWTRWAMYGAAVILVIVAAAHIAKGVRASFEKWFAADAQTMQVLRPIGMAGLIARGLVFLILAGMTVYAGGAIDPADPPGMKEALETVQDWPAGWLLLLAMAAGLLSFALYSLSEAVYRRIGVPSGLR